MRYTERLKSIVGKTVTLITQAQARIERPGTRPATSELSVQQLNHYFSLRSFHFSDALLARKGRRAEKAEKGRRGPREGGEGREREEMPENGRIPTRAFEKSKTTSTALHTQSRSQKSRLRENDHQSVAASVVRFSPAFSKDGIST